MRYSQLPFSVYIHIRVIQYGLETHEGLPSISLLLNILVKFSARCTCTIIVYSLAHAKQIQNIFPMNAARNIQSKCQYFVSSLPHEQKKRVTAGQVFVLWSPVVSRSENGIGQRQAINFFNNIQTCTSPSVGGNTKCAALCTIRLGVLPGRLA